MAKQTAKNNGETKATKAKNSKRLPWHENLRRSFNFFDPSAPQTKQELQAAVEKYNAEWAAKNNAKPRVHHPYTPPKMNPDCSVTHGIACLHFTLRDEQIVNDSSPKRIIDNTDEHRRACPEFAELFERQDALDAKAFAYIQKWSHIEYEPLRDRAYFVINIIEDGHKYTPRSADIVVSELSEDKQQVIKQRANHKQLARQCVEVCRDRVMSEGFRIVGSTVVYCFDREVVFSINVAAPTHLTGLTRERVIKIVKYLRMHTKAGTAHLHKAGWPSARSDTQAPSEFFSMQSSRFVNFIWDLRTAEKTTRLPNGDTLRKGSNIFTLNENFLSNLQLLGISPEEVDIPLPFSS